MFAELYENIYDIANDPVLQYHLKQRAEDFRVLGQTWRQQITGLLSMGVEGDWPVDVLAEVEGPALPTLDGEGPGDDEVSEYESDGGDIVMDGDDEEKDEDEDEDEDGDEEETLVGSPGPGITS